MIYRNSRAQMSDRRDAVDNSSVFALCGGGLPILGLRSVAEAFRAARSAGMLSESLFVFHATHCGTEIIPLVFLNQQRLS